MSTDHRPSVDQLLTDTSVKYRPTIGEVSAKSWRSVGERKAISAKTHLERLSTVSRQSVDPLSTAISTECRPTTDRVSTAISTAISVNITHSKQDPPFLHCKGLRTAMYKCYINSIIFIIIWCKTIWLPQESISMLERRSSCPFPRIMIQYHIQ